MQFSRFSISFSHLFTPNPRQCYAYDEKRDTIIYLFNARFSCFRIFVFCKHTFYQCVVSHRAGFLGDFSVFTMKKTHNQYHFRIVQLFNWWLTTLKCTHAWIAYINHHRAIRMWFRKFNCERDENHNSIDIFYFCKEKNFCFFFLFFGFDSIMFGK